MQKIRGVRAIIAVAACLAIIFVSASCYLKYFANNTYTKSLYVRKLAVTEDSIRIEGDTVTSAEGYKGCSYYVKSNSMYIRPRYFIGGSGMFDIVVKGDMREIDKVYLQGAEADDLKLVWQRAGKD